MTMLVLAVMASCAAEPESRSAIDGETPPETAVAPGAATLSGRVLLPGEGGRRGVELHAWVTAPDGEAHRIWVLPDDDGRFAQAYAGVITRLRVFAGSEVLGFDVNDLPATDDRGRVDLGEIDLRERLVAYRVHLRAADGAPGGVVRAGLSVGPWHTGPNGELPSLGSRQFPPLDLGRVAEWLLPPDTNDVYVLVERPDGPGRGRNWRSGPQQVFGPYDASAFPIDLVMD